MEIFAQIKDLDWSLVPSSGDVSGWPLRLWPMDKHYHWTGTSGGYGVGWGAPASVGAALANRDEGRFSVSIQADGDLMYAPGVLWTAARHAIPLLAVMHNNRGYHQEVMHVQRLANFRDRMANLGNDLGPVGTSIMNPDIEYHKLAESMGWWAKGPIKDPADLGAAIKEAVDAGVSRLLYRGRAGQRFCLRRCCASGFGGEWQDRFRPAWLLAVPWI
jgi:thiamine pyrophosphate-dependent acetolactate synthase large subunit-like protein